MQWDQWVEQEIYSQLPQKVQLEQELLLAALPSEVLLNLEALEQVLAVQLEVPFQPLSPALTLTLLHCLRISPCRTTGRVVDSFALFS